MEIQREAATQNPITGDTEVVRTQETVMSPDVAKDLGVNRTNAIVWYIVSLLEILLALRLAFLLFNARDTGFASFIYGVTHPFVSMFMGIFPSQTAGAGSYFETATLLAMVVYALIGWAITALLDVALRSRVE